MHERGANALLGERDLRGVAAELLAEGDGHGVHQVGAPGLDDVLEALGLAREGALELLQRGQQLVLGDVERGEVHGGGKDVVGGLAEVDVVVGVHALAGERGDDLVGVHVRGGAGAGLEDVDRELRVVLAGGDRGGGLLDARGAALVEQPELAVDGGGGALDARQPVDDGDRDGLPGDREVLDGLGGLPAPQLLAHSLSFCPRSISSEPYPQNALSSRATPTGSS